MATKKELIDAIAAGADISKQQAEKALASLAEFAGAELKRDGEILLPDLGKITKTDTPARKGRNPATGAEIDIAPGHRFAFKATKGLKDSLAA